MSAVAAARSLASALPELVGVARLSRGEHAGACFDEALDESALVAKMLLAHFDDLRNLVVALAQQRIEIVPRARRFLGRGDEAVVGADEREHDCDDRAEHE